MPETSVPPPQITIVTVVLDAHFGYVRQQIPLIEALNPGVPFKLIVVNNTAPDFSDLSIDHPNVQIIPGVAPDLSLPEHSRGSYHHAAALNLAVKLVDTPYLLVLDPDFFVVYRNWITDCIDHMRRRALSLFGAPWNYVWNRKWRYFPCVHFLLVDMGKIDRDQLDFTPALIEDAARAATPMMEWLRGRGPILRSRILLESRRDTGWRLHERFSRARPRVDDVVQPVIDAKIELRNPRHLTTPRGRWFETIVPRRWSFLPAPGSYAELDQSPAFKFGPIRTLAPEKFAWRGAPFAVHLRGHMREDLRTDYRPAYKERTATRQLLDGVHGARSWVEWAFSTAQAEAEG